MIMNDVVALESTLGNGAAGFVSVILFAAAWYLNYKLNGKNWSPFLVMPVAFGAAMLLYASTWSATWQGWLASFLGGLGNLFGVSMPTTILMSVIFVGALVAMVMDLLIERDYNVAAVWALLIAPVAAHGAGGVVGNFAEGMFGGMALAVIGAVNQLFGA